MVEIEQTFKTVCKTEGHSDRIHEVTNCFSVVKIPTKMKLIGFEFFFDIEERPSTFPRANHIPEISEHPIGNRIVYSLSEDKTKDDFVDISPLGEKLWTALFPNEGCLRLCPVIFEYERANFTVFDYMFRTEDLDLDITTMSLMDLHKLKTISICSENVYDFTKSFSSKIRAFKELYTNGIFVQDEMVWQIGLVQFYPHTEWSNYFA